MAMMALMADALGGRATCRDSDGEVQPLWLLSPLLLHSPPGGEKEIGLNSNYIEEHDSHGKLIVI